MGAPAGAAAWTGPASMTDGDSGVPLAILAPAGRDAAVAAMVLERAGFPARMCADMAALCLEVEQGAGVLVLAEEALTVPARAALLRVLHAQPSWSDLPVVLLTGEGELSRPLSPQLRALSDQANVTLLERPVRVATLVTAVRSAMRARRRQLDVRDHLAARSAGEAALHAAREQAEEANRSKGEFLAVMSHELRTPLNAIGGYAELLEMGIRGPITTEQREDLHRIQMSQRHLLGLINQVLNYTRVETGKVHYELRDIVVSQALAAAEVLVAPQVSAKGLTCRVGACSPELRVRADHEKLQQILLNLLTNAVKFTERTGTIDVSCSERDGMVAIRVSDTGIGIAADKLARVFEPFVQVDATLTRTHEGVGLGLAISRDLARGMKGELSVESDAGAGSTFTLTLPKAD